MKIYEIAFYLDDIENAAAAVGTVKELTPAVRKMIQKYLDSRIDLLSDDEIKSMINRGTGEQKFAIRVALRVLGRRGDF